MKNVPLLQLLSAREEPQPWVEGDNIPWHDPDFSRRMLREHLDQSHDRASRRFYTVDRHVAWLHRNLLDQAASNILDLGCGPGLYCHRLAALGHSCTGIDYSPASIAYARAESHSQGLACRFLEGDIRQTDYPAPQDLVLLLFGEFNVFRPHDARQILHKARTALTPDGKLVMEVHTEDAVQRMGRQDASWFVAESGLFDDTPHACLTQPFWSEVDRTATIRYYIIDLNAQTLTRYAQTLQAYSIPEYRELLQAADFSRIDLLPGLTDNRQEIDFDFQVFIAASS